MIHLEKYSFGTGDRFGMQGNAQLKAVLRANRDGIPVVPVWNKSNREHAIVGTTPESTWQEAEESTKALKYNGSWYVDADHINLETVDPYIDHSSFFTIDVADFIGQTANSEEHALMVRKLEQFTGDLQIPGISRSFSITRADIERIVSRFYVAIREAGVIYQHILAHKGAGSFIAEISMDEVEQPQSPVDLFFILMMIGHFGIPAQTIAPKFTGRFNKGVDYVGDIEQFRQEFEDDLLVISHAIDVFSLPENLKLSIHSGSDKFSIYPVIGELIRKHDAGIHVKTAGTTWLEEIIGLALAGGEALDLAKRIYNEAYHRREELCAPYATVIDIDFAALPATGEVDSWSSEKFVNTLRHIPEHPDYDPGFRQLIHVGYKVASEMGTEYLEMLRKYRDIVEQEVETNIYDRHIIRIFGTGPK